MKYLILALLLAPIQANAAEIHLGFLTKHINDSTYYDESASNFYSKRHANYNEKNNLILVFNNDGLGIGTMKNSYGKRSYLIQQKYSINDTCYGINCSYSASLGLATGYEYLTDSGLIQTFAASFGINKNGLGLNMSLFNFTAVLGTFSYTI